MALPPPTFLVLPDTFRICPLKDAVNPHFTAVATESRAWATKYDIIVSDRKRGNIRHASSSMLAAHAFPYAKYDQFRMICDWISLLFVIDEVTDEQSGKEAEATGLCVIKSLEDVEWDDGSMLAEMTKSFREKLVCHGTPDMLRRFVSRVKQYIHAVTGEAELRQQDEVPDMETYIPLRRHNSAVVSCVALVEYGIGVDIPDIMWQNDIFMSAVWAVVDFVAYTNDLFSYDMEQAEGTSGNNIVSVVMKEKGLNLQDAVNHAGEICEKLMNTYLKAKEDLQQLQVGEDVIRFVEAMGHWTIGNIEWSFSSARYFGSSGDEVRKTRIVKLRPRSLPELSAAT
ncbi:terpenoid synthase [Cyathus striatus]|nr:terpenoid synthase [Cyathus striatus]